MKIISDTTGGAMTHIRDIKIEDGPVLDAGSNYAMGTRFKIDYVCVIFVQRCAAEEHHAVLLHVDRERPVGDGEA